MFIKEHPDILNVIDSIGYTVLHEIIYKNNSEQSTTLIPAVLSSAEGVKLLKVERNWKIHKLTPSMDGMYDNKLKSTKILIKQSLGQLNYSNSVW